MLGLAVLALVLASSAVVLGNGSVVEASTDWAASSDGVGEPVAVHGDWIVEVRDIDGSLDHRGVFSNDLTGSGAEMLSQLLVGQAVSDDWTIRFESAETGPCSEHCSITGGSDLRVASGDGLVTLAGSVAATRAGSIEVVSTLLGLCPTDGGCSAGGDAGVFTTTGIDSVDVEAGQLIEVTVVISFS